MKESFFITRHSIKPSGNEESSINYPGITERGVDLAKERALDLKNIIDSAPKDAIVFIGGATYEDRTKSTAQVYGEKLKKVYEDEKDIIVLDKNDLQEMITAAKSIKRGVSDIADFIKNNSNKKIILDYPLFINELDFGRGWGFWNESEGAYAKYLFSKYKSDELAAVQEWIKTGAMTENGLKGPNPNDIADNYGKGLKKIKEFLRDKINDSRPVVIGAVGHRWDLDVFITKLIKGDVNWENFQVATNGELTNETEGVYLSIDEDKLIVSYRGNNYEIEK